MKGRPAAGFTSFELLVAIIIISTLVTVLLDRVLYYQEAAEKTNMEQMVGTLRSALQMRVADSLIKGPAGGLQGIADENPMDWLAQRPTHYVGERFGAQADEVAKGSWYFDLKSRQLVYRLKRSSYFLRHSDGYAEIRFAVRVVYAQPQAGSENADKQEINGVIFTSAEPYHWF